MRIAIVNDTGMAVEAMRRVLLRSHAHELAWVARDGVEAVQRCSQDTPDLVLMDLIMPLMDGVEATRQIMARNPCAIVVVTADVNHSTSRVFEAMGAGALDAVNTPTIEQAASSHGSDALLGKIRTINRLIGSEVGRNTITISARPKVNSTRGRSLLVAIGASAGGPAALARVLAPLPADFPAAIVITQHVDFQFAEGLARWLSSQSRLQVRLAEEGDRPEPGTVLLAGTEDHLAFIAAGVLGYTAQPLDCPYQPSIDIFFNSIEQFWHGDVVGVLLTGMGRDGARGLKALRDAGHHTLVQDKATSAVYGMPKAAIEMKAASEVLPIEKIGPRLAAFPMQKHTHHV